jgi:hypothetical protein
MAIGVQSFFEIRNRRSFSGYKVEIGDFPVSLIYSEHNDTGMYQVDVPVYCNQLWGATFKRYKQDPTENLEELHDAHMRRLNERLG